MATTATERTEPTTTERTARTLTEPTGPTATARTEPTATEPTAPPDPEPEPTGLAALIGAAEAERLLERAFGRDAFRSRMAPAQAARLFGWPQLNAALADHRLAPPRLRLERAGADVTRGVLKARRSRRGLQLQDVDAAALTAQLREGATLIIDAVNELSPPLRKLCAELAAEFAAAAQANLYACWGETQGFDVHWDDHEVFVVQVEGRKRWSLYGPTETWPARRGARPEAAAPQTPREIFVLQAGDVLYLPRGYWHAAVGLGGPSLHLTIGLTRKTGADFLHWLADDLQSAELVRSDLPFEAGWAALAARIGEVLAEVARGDPQALARRYRRHVDAAQVQRPELSFPDIGGEDVGLAPADRLRLGAGAARLDDSAGGLVLSWRGAEFTLSPSLEAPLRRLLAGADIAYAELEAAAARASPGEAQALVREMIRRGVFVRVPDAGAAS